MLLWKHLSTCRRLVGIHFVWYRGEIKLQWAYGCICFSGEDMFLYEIMFLWQQEGQQESINRFYTQEDTNHRPREYRPLKLRSHMMFEPSSKVVSSNHLGKGRPRQKGLMAVTVMKVSTTEVEVIIRVI